MNFAKLLLKTYLHASDYNTNTEFRAMIWLVQKRRGENWLKRVELVCYFIYYMTKKFTSLWLAESRRIVNV